MAWSRPSDAAQPTQVIATSATVEFGHVRGFAATTSTSTIVVVDAGVPRLRTYGIRASALVAAYAADPNRALWEIAAVAPTGPCVGTATDSSCSTDRIGYMDSGKGGLGAFDCAAAYTAYNPQLVAIVDEVSGGACGNENVRSTCVPEFQRHCLATDAEWEYDYISSFFIARSPTIADPPIRDLFGGIDPLTGSATISRGSARLSVVHKDPHVLELPNGAGWLMLLARSRAIESVAATDCEDCGQAQTTPGEADGDIVAWWSDNPEFDDGAGSVRGPFFMVDSLRAVPGLTLRFWLGVPSGVVVDTPAGTSLLLYYQIEPPFAGSDPLGKTPLDDSGATREQGLTLEDWELAVQGYLYSGLPTQVFEPGLALKRIDLGDLLAFLATGSTDEANWTASDCAPGELLGQVRLWACDVAAIGPFPAVMPFQRWFDRSGTAPKPADPCAVLSPKGLNLFFAANVAGGSPVVSGADGYGIWRGVAAADYADSGTALEYTTDSTDRLTAMVLTRPVFGIDILMCVANDARGLPRDMVQESSGRDVYLDPDAIEDPTDQTWRVYAGNALGGALLLVIGDPADGTSDWTDAWCSPSDQAAAKRRSADDPLLAEVYGLLPWLNISTAEGLRSGGTDAPGGGCCAPCAR